MGWTEAEQNVAEAARFLLDADLNGECTVVGVVGGASSGKSTLVNALVGLVEGGGARYVSTVMMRAHTTRGPLVCAAEPAQSRLRDWVTRCGWGGFRNLRESARAGPAAGEEGGLTVVPCSGPTLARVAILDTPDFTSLASRQTGDVTRSLLPWLDRVIVVVDEDRWFDEQVFGWLAARLEALIPRDERAVVFNRTQRGGESGERLGEAERAALLHRGQRLGTTVFFLEHQPGRGLVDLTHGPNAGRVAEIAAWAAREGRPDSVRRRVQLLVQELRGRCAAVVIENDRRRALLARLARTMETEQSARGLTDRQVAYDVLLTPEQQRQLDPIWQALVRPLSWLGGAARAAGLARSARGADEEPGTIAQRGQAFFVRQVTMARDQSLSIAMASEIWQAGGVAARPPAGGAAILERGAKDGAALARTCQERFEEFTRRFEAGAREVRLGAASTGAGVIGAVIGAILALPAGGVTAPLGAAMGAAIGASTLAAGGRSVYRLLRLIAGTAETRALWESVKALREGMERYRAEAEEEVLAAAKTKVLADGDELLSAAREIAGLAGPSRKGGER
jgi:hypothetical protein